MMYMPESASLWDATSATEKDFDMTASRFEDMGMILGSRSMIRSMKMTKEKDKR